MDLDFGTIIFYALAVVAVLPGVMILFTKDIVRVAFWLLAALSGVAGLYIMLDADFLGATQVLVYIGGIMVLILFGIMMTNKDPIMVRAADKTRRATWPGLAVAVVTFAALMLVIGGFDWKTGAGVSGAPTTKPLGRMLLTDYVLPFEIISVLLLMVLCGAAYMARRDKEPTDG